MKEHAGQERQPEGSETERVPAVAAPAAAILALQRSAGNAAVTRMLARAPGDAPIMLPGLNTQYTPGPGSSLGLGQVPVAVQMAVDTYLDNHTADILEKVMAGTISVPEMVAELRQMVPQAATVDASAIAGLVGSHRFSNATLHIPDVRGKVDASGLTKQAEASIANALPSVPTSVTLRGSAGTLTLSISGVKLQTAKDGVHITAEAGKDGPSVEAKKGDVSAGASAK